MANDDDYGRVFSLGPVSALPIEEGTYIKRGAAVGIDLTTQEVGPIQPGWMFVGFASSPANHIPTQQRDTVITLIDSGKVVLKVDGASQADVGKDVYATDDDTFTLTSTGASFVGVAKQLHRAGYLVVEISPQFGLNTIRRSSDGRSLVDLVGNPFLPGAVVSGSWMTPPSFFNLRINGGGTLQMDSRDSLGNITLETFAFTTLIFEPETEFNFELPSVGVDAVDIRVTLTGTLTCQLFETKIYGTSS